MAFREYNIPDVGQVVVYKRKQNRSVKLSIASDGKISVSQPTWLAFAVGLRFINAHKDWIINEVKRRDTSQVVLEDGQRYGRYHKLKFSTNLNSNLLRTRVSKGVVSVLIPSGMSYLSEEVQQKASKAVEKALRIEAERLLPARLREIANSKGFDFKSVSIKKLRSRWGSCTSKRDITLNYYLMQLPWDLIDYVLLHELVHTKHMNHGELFWGLFEKHLPGAKKERSKLRKYSPRLTPNQ